MNQVREREVEKRGTPQSKYTSLHKGVLGVRVDPMSRIRITF